MTQMLLFDSPQNTTTLLPVTAEAVAATPASVPATSPTNVAAQVHQDSGLNHMGDLARLVLLRYDLVARRRAQMAARKAK